MVIQDRVDCVVASGVATCPLVLSAGQFIAILNGPTGIVGRTFVTATAAPQLLSSPSSIKSKARLHIGVNVLAPEGMQVILRTAGGDAAATNCRNKIDDASAVTVSCSVPELQGPASIHFVLPGTASEVDAGAVVTVSPGNALKVGFILVGETSDFGWNYNHNLARLELMAKFGALVETMMEENVEEFGPNACPEWCTWQPDVYLTHRAAVVGRDMIEKGARVIFATSFWFQFDMVGLAEMYPDVKFVFSGGGWVTMPNMAQVFPKIYQGRYLAGILAAQRPEVQRTKRVGYISAFRTGETVRAINAFKLGLAKVDPEIKVLLVWQHSWFNPRKERLVVERFAKHHDIPLIMQHTDSTAPQLTAQQMGIEGIGYNGNMLYTVGDSVLASTIMNWGPIYSSMVQSILFDEWTPDLNFWPGAVDEATAPWRIPELSPRVSPEERATLAGHFAAIMEHDDIFCPPMVDQKGRARNPDGECLGDGDVNQCCAEYEGYNCVDHWLLEGIIEECAEQPGENEIELVDGACFVGVLDIPDVCPVGQELTIQGCTPCPVGMVGQGDDKCIPCPEGTYAPEPGMAACLPCAAGTFTPPPYEVTENGRHVGHELSPAIPGRLLADLSTFAGCLYQCEMHPECVGVHFANVVGEGHDHACTLLSSVDATEDTPGYTAVRFRSLPADACVACPSGTFAQQRAAGCSMCNPGFVAPDVGTASCEECPAGTVAPNSGATKCDLCEPGSANPVPGFTTCEVCPPGYEAAAPGTATCSKCEIGFYAAEPGTPTCSVCPDTFTTLAIASASLSACACAEGLFWSVPDDTCKPCPLDAFCPGGLYLPVVRPAKYGLLKGSLASYAAAVEAKHSVTFDKANFPDAISDMIVYNCHSLDLCPSDPAFESEADTPWDFEFYGVDRKTVDGTLLAVRHGSPESDTGSSCTYGRSGVACGRCEEGSYGRIECTECSGAANGLNAVLLLVLPFIMMTLYRATSAKDTRRVQTAFVMVSTFGMGAFVIQTVAVFDSFAMNWPIQLTWVFTLSDIFMFDMGGLSLSCLSGQDFQPKYWLSLMVPVLIVFMTGVGFMLSKVLPVPAGWVMERNQTFNMLGMLLTALYVTLVKIVVAYFECTDNPSQGHETLLRYRDVECASEERMGATAPMVLGLLVYVIGFYVKFLHIAYSAPGEWPKPQFREKWRFMLTRWRPDVWFWGSLVMTRNLLVALSGIVSAEPRVQLIYLVWVVTTVFTLTAVWQPWRIPSLNISDVLSCFLLNGIGVFGLVFVSLDDEIDLNTRLGRTGVAQRQKDLQDALAVVLAFLFAAFGLTFLSVIGWALALLIPGQAAAQEAGMDKVLKELYTEALETINDSNIQVDMERLVYNSTDHDRLGLRSILTKLRTSPEQITQTGYFGSKDAKQPAKKQVVTSTQVTA